ncbi:Ubiquinone biosynthesis protein coq9, mitochondrial [Xylographa pallens]|nr:Ubiquinone biosynthesis protein coq9, mitochondrial [Xylographa pallens]
MAVSRTTCPRLSCLRGSTLTKRSTVSPFHRYYHSYEHDPEPSFTGAEDSILSAALDHVPSQGFTTLALTRGAEDAGYLDVSTNLFPRGPFDLINYHLVTQRLALKDRIQFPDPSIGVGAKVRALALQRLQANKEIIHRWQEVNSASPLITPSLYSRITVLPVVSCATSLIAGNLYAPEFSQ